MKYVGLRVTDVRNEGSFQSVSILLYVKEGLDGEYRNAGKITLQSGNNSDNWYGWSYSLERGDYRDVKKLNFAVNKIKEASIDDEFQSYDDCNDMTLLNYLQTKQRFNVVVHDDRLYKIVDAGQLKPDKYKSYIARGNKCDVLTDCVVDSYPSAREKIRKKIREKLEKGRDYHQKQAMENWLESEANEPEQLNNYEIDFERNNKIQEIGLGDYLNSLL